MSVAFLSESGNRGFMCQDRTPECTSLWKLQEKVGGMRQKNPPVVRFWLYIYNIMAWGLAVVITGWRWGKQECHSLSDTVCGLLYVAGGNKA